MPNYSQPWLRHWVTTSKGDVFVVHDDIPRITWKMAVIEDMIMGGDGLM